ncbi:hypothetical protein MtrunA17_Chr1g0154631 [Medicago truncatula]|uniref:Uncharacterized protein n=1 Tax=Medicago truncatula TaxID=3880 RepID=A0A396JJR4_MEDTR|nr:hypothetical protein MtrunA17_Chr1g0154631 [Medicago truncatula]
MFLNLSGIKFINGWAFMWLLLNTGRRILFNLVLLVAHQRCVNPSYRLYDLRLYGKYGKKETTGCSQTKFIR